MEWLDIVDELGEPTGQVEERSKVHEKGYLHHTSHVWIVRDNPEGNLDVLLQKRSRIKDSFPGCYDISSAGHIPAGAGYIDSALRELHEELGIEAKAEELEDRGVMRFSEEHIFHGKVFKDEQVCKVYRMKRNELDISQLYLQEEEVEEVIWMSLDECIIAVKNQLIPHCMYTEELERLKD